MTLHVTRRELGIVSSRIVRLGPVVKDTESILNGSTSDLACLGTDRYQIAGMRRYLTLATYSV
jgi:hypothetical protein